MIILFYIFICACLGVTTLAVLSKFKIIDLNSLLRMEIISFIFSVGFLMFTIYMFILGMINLKYSRNIFIPLYVNALFAIFYVIRLIKTKKPLIINKGLSKKQKITRLINASLIFSIALIFISFFAEALSNFLVYPDEFSHWGIQAKNIFIGKKMNTFTPTGIESYPNFLPLLYSGYYFLASTINENAIRIFSAIFCLLTYINCLAICRRRNLNTTYFNFLFLVFLMFYATIVQISSSTYADIPFMCFYSTGILYLLEYLFTGNKNSMVISLFSMIGSTWVKTDGLYLILYTYVFVVIARKFFKKLQFTKVKWSELFRYILISLSLILCWKLYVSIFNFPAGVGAPIELRLDYFIAMSSAIRDQFFANHASSLYLVLLIFSFLFLYDRLSHKSKIYCFSLMSFMIVNILFLVVCYLVKFGAEGPLAASFIRYISRIMPLMMICILEFFKEKNIKRIGGEVV